MKGTIHPITRFISDTIDIFSQWGFEVVTGPEIESEKFNFDVLRIKKNHPARDSHDTFWVDKEHELVLRTHTSAAQVPVMLKRKPPVRLLIPGRVFRNDNIDATHMPLFHHIEGLVIDKNVTISELKGTLLDYIHGYFGKDIKVRFRPNYFPFVEPGYEVDIWWDNKWLEMLGCGMIHPEVLQNMNIDPTEFSGFAFGTGVERPLMVKYKINNIRHFYNSDYRFLKQF